MKLRFKDIMGIGDWGLGIGDWGMGNGGHPQTPKPQSPSPNTNSLLKEKNIFNN